MSERTAWTIHLTFTNESYAELNQLSWKLKVPLAEVVRVALNMLQILAQETDEGSRLLIEREGKTMELSLLNLEELEEEELAKEEENVVHLYAENE